MRSKKLWFLTLVLCLVFSGSVLAQTQITFGMP